MALGGGTFLTMNKALPGSYINVISQAKADASLSDRGVVAMALELDWGPDREIFEIASGDFIKNSLKLLGYDYTADSLKGIRDLFAGGAKTLYTYRLNSGEKAKSDISEAAYSGERGNTIWHDIEANADDETLFDVSTYWDGKLMDTQTVADAAELTDVAGVVTFNKKATLSETTKLLLSGGTNGTADGAAHQDFLDKIEAYSYNAIGVYTTTETVKQLYVAFNKRMRDEVGAKAQCVVYNYAADYEGVVNVKNKVTDDTFSEAALVFWTLGAIGGCAVNASNTNKKYHGEFTVNAAYTQTELEKAVKAGEFILHKVGDEVRVLRDINSLVTTTLEKGSIFCDNKVVRVADQIANDTATLFNTKYLGVFPNNQDGRVSLWNDLVKLHEELQRLGALQEFDGDLITVDEGDDKNDVVVTDGPLNVVGTMEKLYMTVILV